MIFFIALFDLKPERIRKEIISNLQNNTYFAHQLSFLEQVVPIRLRILMTFCQQPFKWIAAHSRKLSWRVGVVTAAASCLKKILSTSSGADLLKSFEESKQQQLLWYLEPFKPSKKKRASIFLFLFLFFFVYIYT